MSEYGKSSRENYQRGDHVSIKAVVIDSWAVNENHLLTLSRLDRNGNPVNFDIPASEVDRKLPMPLPEEPEHSLILKSRKGDLYTWKSDGWQRIGGGYRMAWDFRFYNDNGPFQLFAATTEL